MHRKYGPGTNLEEPLWKHTTEHRETSESEIEEMEILQKHISRDEVQTFAEFIREQCREIINGLVKQKSCRFVNLGDMQLRCSKLEPLWLRR